MNIPSITPIFVVSKQIYDLACELGIDTSASIEYGCIDEVVYQIHCTQQDYILLKKMAEEL